MVPLPNEEDEGLEKREGGEEEKKHFVSWCLPQSMSLFTPQGRGSCSLVGRGGLLYIAPTTIHFGFADC